MADILIRGMEMPANCCDCALTYYEPGEGSSCIFTEVPCLNIGRQNKCPLVPIPEGHGRLGDLDKLAASFRESAEECKRLADAVKGDPLKEVNNKAIYAAIIEAILRTKAAPTIVPAEGETDE